MNTVFLGRALHWLVLLVLVAAGWLAGSGKFHIVHFNLFVGLLIAIVVSILVLLLNTTAKNERFTRDEIPPDE